MAQITRCGFWRRLRISHPGETANIMADENSVGQECPMPQLRARLFSTLLILAVVLLLTFAAVSQESSANAPYMNPALPVEQRVNDLIGRMTLEEKVAQMRDHATAIPRLGVPKYDWWNEGLHGVA